MQDLRIARLALIGLWLASLVHGVARADGGAALPAWPDTFAARIEALALLQTLNAELLSHDSATVTLEHWCELHRMAPVPRVVAVQLHTESKAPTDAQRLALRVSPTETIRYRHVQLVCGSVVLSEAENWYVPARLPAPMNHLLETTDTPFGAVVRELQFQRHTLSARLLWMPLPSGWEMNSSAAEHGSGKLHIPEAVLEHRAVLALTDGTPFSEVVETYTGNVLAFPPPPTSDGRR
jgi:chorismate-pyruvate lyase